MDLSYAVSETCSNTGRDSDIFRTNLHFTHMSRLLLLEFCQSYSAHKTRVMSQLPVGGGKFDDII